MKKYYALIPFIFILVGWTVKSDKAEIYTPASNATPALYSNSSGNVGIGTTTINDKLQVNGNVAINNNLKLKESGGNDQVSITVPSLVAPYTLTLPTTAGSNEQMLKTNGSGALSFGAVDLTQAAAITGALPIGNGGSGQITANAALNAFLPTQTANTSRFLKTDGTNTSWGDAGSGGSGGVNVITNASAVSDTTGWADDANHTNTRLTSGSPLDPIVTTALSFEATASTAESSTSGVYWAVGTMPTTLRSKKLKVEFYCIIPAGDVWRVSAYQGTTRLSLSTDASSVTTLPAGFTGKFTTYVDTTTGTAYSVNFTKTTHSAANALVVTQVVFGDGTQPQGAVVGEWQSYTSSITNGTPGTSTATAYWRRVGSSMEIQYSLIQTASGTAGSGTYFWSIPSGYTINTSVLPVSAGTIAYNSVGTAQVYDGGGPVFSTGSMNVDSSTGDLYLIVVNNGSGSNTAVGSSFRPFNSSATMRFSFNAKIPIAEWAGSGLNVAQNDVEYSYNSSTATAADDTTSFAYGPSGALIQNITAALTRRVRFQTPIQTTDRISIEIADANRLVWFPLEARVTDSSGSGDVTASTRQNAINYGIGRISKVSGSVTDVSVIFHEYSFPNGATFGAAGQAWSTGAGSFYWRLVKAKSGQAVGFGIVTETSSGLVPASGSLGTVRVATQNGYGSTNTTIRKFSVIILNTATDITYTSSATNGDSFTVTRSGIYSISYTDTCGTSCNMGVSRNSSQLTSNIAGITQANRIALMSPTGDDQFQNLSVTLYLTSGDVIRAHGDGSGAATSTTRTHFLMQRIY